MVQPMVCHLLLTFTECFFNQIRIQGSTMGNDEEFAQMLAFVNEKQIKPIISSVRPFDEIVAAFDEMKSGKHFGKLVVKF